MVLYMPLEMAIQVLLIIGTILGLIGTIAERAWTDIHDDAPFDPFTSHRADYTKSKTLLIPCIDNKVDFHNRRTSL